MVQRSLEESFSHDVCREQAYVWWPQPTSLIRKFYAISDRFRSLKSVTDWHVFVCDDEIVDFFTSVEAILN